MTPSVSPSYKEREKILGRPLAEALGLDDVVYEIDNKSITNRPDLWGHYGMARDLAAVLPSPLTPLPLQPLERLRGRGETKLQVKVEDKKLCPRYMAAVVDGIEIKPSPAWMQKRLISCGMRPISNIVDITNYVMLELGQPTHAFDAQKLGNTIIVRRAKQNEKITTLDGQERKLDEEMLLITDGKNPVAIAGVMGGGNSEIDDSTKSIVIESANFNPISIRQTSQKLGLRSEASMRFEKSLDPNLCEVAIQRIISLIKASCPQAKAASNLADIKNFKLNQGPIKLNLEWLNKKIGVEMPKAKVVKIFKSLGFVVSGGKMLSVKVPTWRATKDVSLPEDLAEEVVRIYGYDNIKLTMPQASMQAPEVNEEREFVNKLKDILSGGAGMTEVYNYSFVNEARLKKLNIDADKYIKLANPLTNEYTLLRQTIHPLLLENVVANQRNFKVIKVYEVGNVFWNKAGQLKKDRTGKEKLPHQQLMLSCVYASEENDNFFKLKGIIEYLLLILGIKEVGYSRSHDIEYASNESRVEVGGELTGYLFNIDGNIAKNVGIKINAAICELDLASLFKRYQSAGAKSYQPKNKFPFVYRDLAFVIDEKILYNDFKEAMLGANGLIKEVELFDLYTGDKVGNGKKNLAFHITFGDPKKTLTGEDADKAQDEIVKHLNKKFGAQLRDF
ncbi:phenylalanine--tRNA ligase subunit beta [Candidatus Falkowbacteria bacterium CG10_big_fil_rev_8_21_14_0_10_43_10]|uniref:Phenylalanine--tRNA ligase beta subunit n=1 Tax=Candidatus Falkowbacteria bacterium CG10_big_fil_rev_8_21_14_0_10_43_10 TaxID=1974567 RepID=A0A2H0V1E7_9BACT|nr:MAG: phenylalanine--tRNA ligase subunit beta [Candidatus Falkowbacteria bacterium CG10_big_fil_rev_8_21_14_0_10_43_10]